MNKPRRAVGLCALAAYLACACLLPALHLAHHQADHVHGADGSLVWTRPSVDAEGAAPLESEHVAFDDDLTALNLSEVGHFGIAQVDCDLADYTLATCAGAEATHSFGDELIARLPHHHAPAPWDPEHGRASLSHFRLALLTAVPLVLPPPHLPLVRLDLPRPLLVAGAPLAPRLRARAPPSACRPG